MYIKEKVLSWVVGGSEKKVELWTPLLLAGRFALGLGLSTVKPVLLGVGGVAVLCGPAHSLALSSAMLRLRALSIL